MRVFDKATVLYEPFVAGKIHGRLLAPGTVRQGTPDAAGGNHGSTNALLAHHSFSQWAKSIGRAEPRNLRATPWTQYLNTGVVVSSDRQHSNLLYSLSKWENLAMENSLVGERRQLLRSSLGVGLALVGGCGENPGNRSDTADGGEGSKSSANTAFRIATNAANPNDLQWSKYFAHRRQAGVKFVYDPLAAPGVYPRDVDASSFPDWHEFVAESFTVEGDSLTISLNDEYTWHDGDPLTAADVALQFRLENELGFRTGEVWESLRTPTKQTIEFTLASANSDIALPQILTSKVRTKRGTKFAEFLELLEESTTKSERQSARNTVTTTRVENPVGTGLWQVERTSDKLLTLSKYQAHPVANEINFERLEIQAIPNNQKRRLGLEKGTLDGLVFGTPPRPVEQQFPDHIERIPYISPAGDCFLFNFEGAFGERRVRQAVAYLINRWENSNNAKDYVDVLRYPLGLPNKVMKEWLGESPDGFLRYGYDSSKTEQATSLLEDVGFTREDGQWYTPAGDRFSVDIVSGSGGTWKLNNQTAAATLSEFGIDAVPVVTEGAAFGNRVQQGNYDLAMGGWGAFGGGTHPYNFFSQELDPRELANQNIPSEPLVATVPYPVGNPEGELQEVRVRDRIAALATAESDERAEELVNELAWIYNQFLPKLPLMNGVVRRYISRKEWEFPKKDSQYMVDNPVPNLMRFGKLRAKQA
jgi:peptide/nickel transport system substrate-binding protein